MYSRCRKMGMGMIRWEWEGRLCIKSWDLGGAMAATRMVVGGAWCNQ